MSNAINITGLQRAAEKYDDTLRMLPYLELTPTLDKLGVNFLQVDEKDKIVVFHRKAGLSKPYVVGGTNTVNEEEIGKAIERILDPKECYTALKDHIMNYRAKKVISNKPERIDNKNKRHPLEVQIIQTKIRTVGEDILSALFFGQRNNDDKSPLGMFDGFNEQIDKEITAGDIATAKGNLFETGAIATPADGNDMEAFDKLVAFVRAANPFLRHNGVLYITQPALFNCMDALGNKLKYKNALEWEVFVNHLRGITGAPKLQIISDPVLGTGSRLLLTIPDNLDFGLGTLGDEQFVQVRSPYEDPNQAQFWMQWTSGTRIVSIHKKTFQVNDQTNTGTDLFGDYS